MVGVDTGGAGYFASYATKLQIFGNYNSGSTFQETMRIDSSGNVGIGTTSPNYQIQLYKSGAVANYLQVTSGATGTGAANGTLFGVDSSGNGIVTVQGAVNYITSVAGAERMRIDASGRLMVGTTSPSGLLTLVSTAYPAVSTPNIAEPTTVSATAATGTINYDVTTQSVLYYTSNATANWTLNIRGNSGTSLNTLLSTGQSITIAFMVTTGATAYYASALQIDGVSVTPKYQGGSAWTSGNASSIDVYVYTITKTASATYTVFASQSQFK